MADDDEIDILGDFSFNSCLAQNNQGIPSCSSREDTVHPQWLLDSTATNWYDSDREKRAKLGPARKLSGNSNVNRQYRVRHSSWNQAERDLLVKEMAKYGRNIPKISQTIKTKSAAEIQALIEAEYGVNLDTPSFGLVKNEEQDDIPNVVQEEIVADDSSLSNVLSLVTTASPTITMPNKQPFRKKNNVKMKSILKSNAIQKQDLINPAEIFYDDELVIGSTESVGSVLDSVDMVAKNMVKRQKEKMKAVKKIGNHRRKMSQNLEKGRIRTSSKELLKSPQERRKDSSMSEDSTKSPKLQIVLGSGQALPLSEGEQVIKIEKKKESESDSDIEVDIDSDDEASNNRINEKMKSKCSTSNVPEAPIAVPLTQFEPMPKRQKKINLPQDGGGGYTIAHTAAGDLVRVGAEPRRERAPRRVAVPLIPCRFYDSDHPAPFSVRLNVSALILMDAHAHSSHAEVMGLLGGSLLSEPEGEVILISAYRAVQAAGGTTHCDMDPVSQAEAGAWLRSRGLRVVGWHHSHPRFNAQPSATDLRTQLALQRAIQPALALLTSQHATPKRTVSHYRCFRVEDDVDSAEPIGYQLRVRLLPDASPALLPALRHLLLNHAASAEHRVKMDVDVCPQAKITYLEKCVSSMCHHLRAAGYEEDDPLVTQLTAGLWDIFR